MVRIMEWLWKCIVEIFIAFNKELLCYCRFGSCCCRSRFLWAVCSSQGMRVWSKHVSMHTQGTFGFRQMENVQWHWFYRRGFMQPLLGEIDVFGQPKWLLWKQMHYCHLTGLWRIGPFGCSAVNMARGSLFWSKPLIHLLVIYRIALRQMKIFLFMNSWLTLWVLE